MREDQPSRTARKVAIATVSLGSKPGMEKILPPGIVKASQELLVAAGVAGPRIMRFAASESAVSIYAAFDWMLPGQFEAFAHRKAFFERQVRSAIAAGASQVLVLGAGYDTLAWRLAPEFPAVHFFEIDHPATARLKAKGITAMGMHANLSLIAEDLGRHALADVLKANMDWDCDKQAVILAEGLVMYLPPEAVSSLFEQCAELVGKGSRFVFSYIPSGADGRLDAGRWTGLMLWLQNAIGEPWLWSIRSDELGAFLQQVGWQNAPQLAEPVGLQGIECYAVAARQRSQ